MQNLTSFSMSAEVATAAVKFPKKKWVNFFCIDASDFLSDITDYCVSWGQCYKTFLSVIYVFW